MTWMVTISYQLVYGMINGDNLILVTKLKFMKITLTRGGSRISH